MPLLSRRNASATEAKSRGDAAFLNATRELLAEGHAFGELAIETLSKRAGFSRATFYAYFPDKRDLLIRLTERFSQDLYAQAGDWLEGNDPDLRATLDSVLEQFRKHRSVVGALVEASTYDDEIARLWRDLHERFIAAARDRIQRQHPELEPAAADARAFALVWMTERACYEHLVTGRVADDALLDALELLWRAGVE